MLEETIVTWDLYQTEEDVWQRRAPKAAEAKFPLISPQTSFSQAMKWRVKRTAEWYEHAEWRYLTTCHSPLVQQLKKMFIHLDVYRVEPAQRMEPLAKVRVRLAPLPPPRWIPSLAAATGAASPLQRAAASASSLLRLGPAKHH